MSLSKLKKAIAIFSSPLDRELALKKLSSETNSLQYEMKNEGDDYLLILIGTDAEIFQIKMMLTNEGVQERGAYKVTQPRVELFPAIGATLPTSHEPNREPDVAILDLRSASE